MTIGVNSALIASSGVAALAGGEYLLRRALPRSSLHYPWIPNSHVKFSLDPEQYPGFPLAGAFHTNALGERGSTFAPRESLRPYRILVVGGSAAECPALSDENFWPLVMQEELIKLDIVNTLGCSSIHVGSIGRSLSPVEIQTQALKIMANRYRSIDLVVTFFGASDVLQWMEQECDLQRFRGSMDLKLFFRANCLPPYSFSPLHTASGKFIKQLARRSILRQNINLSMGDNLRILRNRRRNATEFLTAPPGLSDFIDYFREKFDEFLTLIISQGKKIIVIEQPWLNRAIHPSEEHMMWHFSFGEPRKSKAGPYFHHSTCNEIMLKVSSVQKSVADTRNIPFVSLVDKLDANLDNYADYFHQTPRGSIEIGRIVAWNIARKLTSE